MGVPGHSEMVASGDARDHSNCTHRKHVILKIKQDPEEYCSHTMRRQQRKSVHSATPTGQLITQVCAQLVQLSSAM